MKKIVKKVMLLEPIDVDQVKIKRDHYFSNAYIIDLPIDSIPDHVWQDIFEREWKSSRHLWDRKVYIVGSSLRLVTPASSIKEKLDWVKEIVDRTNKGVEEYNLEAEARITQMDEELKKQMLEEEEANIEMIRDTIRKRFAK